MKEGTLELTLGNGQEKREHEKIEGAKQDTEAGYWQCCSAGSVCLAGRAPGLDH